ncbi:MAG: anti-sigma F factor [Eubacterium sp.]|nr:anti-sigma F factor [Eubacterium sp.]
MNVKNEFSLTVDAKSVNEGFCRTAVSAFVTPLDPTIEELADLKTAVSEAVTNCIVHGYREACGKIYLSAQLLENNNVRITIKDKGVGIEDVKLAMLPLYSTGEGDRAGLGFTVMQSFCDRVKVNSASGKGTTVILTKRIRGKSQW